MFVNPCMTVTVSGGTNEENLQLSGIIQQGLATNGFTNVSMSEAAEGATIPLLAQLRAINPDLFDNKIVVDPTVVPDMNTPMLSPATFNMLGNGFSVPDVIQSFFGPGNGAGATWNPSY